MLKQPDVPTQHQIRLCGGATCSTGADGLVAVSAEVWSGLCSGALLSLFRACSAHLLIGMDKMQCKLMMNPAFLTGFLEWTVVVRVCSSALLPSPYSGTLLSDTEFISGGSSRADPTPSSTRGVGL